MGRPPKKNEEKRSNTLQITFTNAEWSALERLMAARELDSGNKVSMAEIARELLLATPQMIRAMK